ncbi:MAG: zinc metalloprotease HtpX [Gammaproteobacteria bacterium]|nr:zinc metalloprotease HtpX [Gammaproteobacteria bacterium]
MPNQLEHYHMSAADWRKTLRQNSSRTYTIILLFFLIYLAIGLLADMYLAATRYPYAPHAQLLQALITFKIYPTATLIMLAIAAISLLVTYSLYDKLMLLGTTYHEITAETAQNLAERQLYHIVEEMKIAASLPYMPKVFIIEADYMNAFASGYSEKSAMVAVTRGLIKILTRDELQAVVAHELSHIRHLDIKLTLTASLLANLSIIALDIMFRGVLFSSDDEKSNGRSKNSLVIIIFILRFVLPLITALLLLYLSRTRELMADAGCVELMRTNQPLASALIKIHQDHQQNKESYAAAYQNTPHENVRREAYLYDPNEAGIKSIASIGDFFSTHPSLETRLAALGFKNPDEK